MTALQNSPGDTDMALFARLIAGSIVFTACTLFAIAADKGQHERSTGYWVERLSSDDPQNRKAAGEALLTDYEQFFEPPLFDNDDEFAAL
jgi:hypothetical protein